MFKKFFLCAYIYVGASFVHAEHTISSNDATLLQPLFRFLLEYSEVGYVIYDKKPMCSVNYSCKPLFFDQFEPYEQLSVAVNAARTLLSEPLFHSKNIVFRFDEKENMLLAINCKVLLKTIRENLPLFQYVLGPTVTPESLLEDIVSSDNAFCEILDYDRVLIGVLLGYGVQNSLFASRLENIQYDETGILDIPPFSPHVYSLSDELMKKEMLFLDNEENSAWKKKSKFHHPSYGFSSLQEEQEALKSRLTIASERLTNVNPNFTFVCLRENQLFLQGLEETQEKIRDLLCMPNWLANTLAMIFEDEVAIEPAEQGLSMSNNYNLNYIMAKFLKHELLEQQYDVQYLSVFAQGLLETKSHAINAEGMPPLAIKNIKHARENLRCADRFFEDLRRNASYIPIMESYLYYKILEPGTGPCLANEVVVSLDFDILDPFDNSLNTVKNINLNLKEAIPGFAYGMKGMQKGEKRVIFIHPALAYGVHTFLEKGIYLKAIVELHELYDVKDTLLPLKPSDLVFLQSDFFQQECEEKYKQDLRFIGNKKRQFLQLCPSLDIALIARYFQSIDNEVDLSSEELDVLNRFFWNLYFARHIEKCEKSGLAA